MKTLFYSFLCAILVFATGCASIVSKSSYPISISSTPSDASISIVNRAGQEVYRGNTPANVQLKASSGFFSKAEYQVTFNMEGYATRTVPILYSLDGWYFGNILFGGLIGLLIVDPATGAMYKLDTEFLNETLSRETASVEQRELKVYALEDIPGDWKDHLITVSE